ncbi:P-loop containing nucleoside triphosphate hydrolase protein [Karstenula rhodostoma CBS 690.94]|uniref:P-loop containing nucleoside triphosphate hydrolase protein n=1 Tax=Karstenula rhodostoma CBS 690.94 TaxID=1392251 RepID=A0A9P4PU91_9PLEO|nr:P-loop containing nucleoside triphosphate hydrolase protein [Karstenula rhodostoma CBS 690.94]
MSAACSTDGSFGPGVGSCRGGFDLTLGFEDSVLGLLPQAVFLALAPIRLVTLRRRRDRVARHSHLGFLKTVSSVLYVFSSIALLAIWSEIDSFKTKLSVASAALEFLSSMLIVALSRMEHSRAIRPSHLLQFFLLVLLLCDAVRLRTLFLMDYPTSLVTPASIHTFLTGLLLLLESLDKRQLFSSDGDRKLPPEETIGLFGKRLFWHLNDLFKEGYRKVLKPTDLSTMDADLASKARAAAFQQALAAQDKSKSMPLLRIIIKILWPELLLPIFPRIIQMATTLSQPYLITAMIDFVEDRKNPQSVNKGYGLIAAFALNYALLAVAFGWTAQSMARFMTKLRGCLISALYEKTLHTSSKDVDLGSATVLMNVDVDKILQACKQLNEIWAAFIISGVAMYIMYTHLGAAFVAPLLTILVATGVTTAIGAAMKARMRLYAAATERRITAIAYVVGNMKGVRMLGLSDTVFQMLTKLRHAEVDASIYFRKLIVWVTLISNSMFQLTTLATYVTFAIITIAKGDGMTLDMNKLYGSLSALKLFTTPFGMVLQILPQIQTGIASLERVERFLLGETSPSEERDDPGSSTSSDGMELSPLRAHREGGHVIALKNATFAIDSQPLLFELTTNFSQGTFSMIVGKVGSGKSVFLRSLVGETQLSSGQFEHSLPGSAFCDQQVWLRNATVRENIVGEDPFDELWYQKVLWSCGLMQDLEEMRDGDNTAIGSKGISLSGGQKNRMSLARALYARKPVLVLDDMLAGLDNTTEKLVFNRVFARNGLLRKSGATVILATHSTHYARHADQIIVMADGRVADQGTYQELLKKNVDFRKFNDGEVSSAANSDEGPEDDIVPQVPSKPVSDNHEDDVARQTGDRRSLIFFIKTIGPLHMTISCVTLVGGIVMTQIQYLWLKWWAEADDQSRSGTIRQLYLFIIVTVINIIAYFAYFVHYALWFQPRLSLNMHANQLVALMRARFSFLVSTDIGSITNRFSQDIMLVDLQLPVAWLNVTFEVLETICSFIIMAIATPPIAATIPVLGVVGYCIQRVYLRTSRQVRLMDLEAKAPLCSNFLETLAGVVTVRAFSWGEAYRKRNDRLLDQSQVPYYLLAAIQNWLTLVLELVVAGMITMIAGLAVGLRTKIDPGYLGLALISAMDLGVNFRVIIVYWTELETSLSAVVRILQFSATPPEESDLAIASPPPSWLKSGAVAFSNFAASYTEDGKTVLNDIDLSIQPGEKIGLCGRTGSGKSSLVATLFGLLHQREGRVAVDGIPTTDVSLSTLRSKIIALPQEPFFLKGTVRYNLTPWNPEAQRPAVSDDAMQRALEEVQLWEKLSGAAETGQSALDLSLDNVDGLLSQGERQLFCLARAILMDGRIVVLDEATSSVDAHTDALMQRILRTAFADRTIIAIAHRLDTILDFDRVVVMDAGRIVEVGLPGELLETEGSLFRALVESQKAN